MGQVVIHRMTTPGVKAADLNPSWVKREARTRYMGSGRIRPGRLFDGGREAA
jgi:hypothetical protein